MVRTTVFVTLDIRPRQDYLCLNDLQLSSIFQRDLKKLFLSQILTHLLLLQDYALQRKKITNTTELQEKS